MVDLLPLNFLTAERTQPSIEIPGIGYALCVYASPKTTIPEDRARNVALFSPDGKMIWRVAQQEGFPSKAPAAFRTVDYFTDPFVGISYTPGDDHLYGQTWNGAYYNIALADGSLTLVKLSRG